MRTNYSIHGVLLVLLVSASTSFAAPSYKVRGVSTAKAHGRVGRVARESPEQPAATDEDEVAVVTGTAARSYPAPGKYTDNGNESRSGKDACVDGESRSGQSSVKGDGRRLVKSKGTTGQSKSGQGRSGSGSAKKCSSKSHSGVPSRTYPPPDVIAKSTQMASDSDSRSASGCSGSRSGSSSKKSKRTRNLKGKSKSKDSSGRSGDECFDFEDGQAVTDGKDKSQDKVATDSPPDRDYPPPPEIVEPVEGRPDSAEQMADDGEGDAVEGDAVEEDAVAVESALMEFDCNDIARGQGPTSDDLEVNSYSISVDLQLGSNTTTEEVETIYTDIQSYLQSEIAPSMAGCNAETGGVSSGNIVNVDFGMPAKSTEPCSLRPDELVEAGACHRTVVTADIYHVEELSSEEHVHIRSTLQDAITGLDVRVEGIEAIHNGNVAAAVALKGSMMAVQEAGQDKKTIGFSIGMAGVVLLSLIAMKVILGRKQRSGKEDHYSMEDDDTFVYPSEAELLGPEFDLALEEQGNANANSYGGEADGNAYYDVKEPAKFHKKESSSVRATNGPVNFDSTICHDLERLLFFTDLDGELKHNDHRGETDSVRTPISDCSSSRQQSFDMRRVATPDHGNRCC
jgi:hypothetical protein